MATMDIIKLAGGQPANFLDVGGGASAEQVKNAFASPLDKKCEGDSDQHLRASCAAIASRGSRERVARHGLRLPVVVRLEGTNVDLGKEILSNSGLPLITADACGMRRRRWSQPHKEIADGHLADKNTRVIVQGITGREERFHAISVAATTERRWSAPWTPGQGRDEARRLSRSSTAFVRRAKKRARTAR